MDKFSELITGVYTDLTSSQNSSLYNLIAVKSAINRAYDKCAALFRWSKTEDAKTTSTQANIEYYDFPSTWRPDSAWKLVIDSKDYGDPLTFADYLYEKEEDMPSGYERMWSQQATRFFVYPTPTAVGTDNISIWGVEVPDLLVNDTDTTIFSYSLRDCNDAIVQEAVAILKSQTDHISPSQFRSLAAKEILVTAWNKMKQEQMKFQKTRPMFDVPDYFGKTGSDELIGKFKSIV